MKISENTRAKDIEKKRKILEPLGFVSYPSGIFKHENFPTVDFDVSAVSQNPKDLIRKILATAFSTGRKRGREEKMEEIAGAIFGQGWKETVERQLEGRDA